MSNSRKKILIYLDRNAHRAPRLFGEYDALIEEYDIILAGDQKPVFLKDEDFVNVQIDHIKSKHYKAIGNYIISKIYNQILKLKLILSFLTLGSLRDFKALFNIKYYFIYKELASQNFDILLCHHISSLPICYYLAKRKRAKLIVNLHEYYPKEFNDQQNWKKKEMFWNSICSRFLPNADLILCVNNSISKTYEKNFKIPGNKILPFLNVKPFEDIEAKQVNPEKIKIIHHGAAIPSRQLDKMVEVMTYLPDNYELTFMLVPSNQAFYDKLLEFKSNKVRFKDVVPTSEISKEISNYDIGLYLLTPSNFNEEHALPNKFFEFIQARLCLVISPSIEMGALIKENDLGIVSDSFEPKEIAAKIKELKPDQIFNYKVNCNNVAEKFSSETSAKELRKRVKELF